MNSPRVSRIARLVGLFCLLVLLLPTESASGAIDEDSATQTGSENSFLESIVDAIRDFFAGRSGGGSGEDPKSASDDREKTNTAAGQNIDNNQGNEGGTAINPNALAQTIAKDAGGHADQYDDYSKRLAATLSKLTPAQRHRVFAAN